MKSKKLITVIIILNVLFLLVNIIAFIQIKSFNSHNTLNNISPVDTQHDDKEHNKIDLFELATQINTSLDAPLISKEFKLVKIVSDSLYELNNVPNGENNELSISYGIEGEYKIDEDVSVKITILDNNIATNGNYIFTNVNSSYESSYYMIENTFVVFDIYINSKLAESEYNDSMLKANEFKESFYNHYITLLQFTNKS